MTYFFHRWGTGVMCGWRYKSDRPGLNRKIWWLETLGMDGIE